VAGLSRLGLVSQKPAKPKKKKIPAIFFLAKRRDGVVSDPAFGETHATVEQPSGFDPI
jgi:hypothetical protein